MIQVSENQSSYLTVGKDVPLLSRTYPSLSFYFSFVGIVLKAGLKARLGSYDDESWCASSVEILRNLEKVGVRLSVSGLEHIKEGKEPVIFIGNHLSVLETTILPSLILPYKRVTYVIKQNLLEYPVFKHVMQSRDPISVTRVNPRQDLKIVLEVGGERLAKGISIIVFPQTTRTPFDPEQFSTIGVKLAKRAGLKVIPIALLTDAWGNGERFKDFGTIDPTKMVHFAFGKPIEIKGKGTEEHQYIIDFIRNHLAEWQGGAVPATDSK